ncbi:Sugar transporter STL1 [Termitomyces sp. T112]|nr:Sugar transporter STL1 [Termitomyces sp. T112]
MVAPAYPKPRRRLVGPPLLYAISIFASLGVFLFGYDQGVMSGIITGPHFINYFGTPGPIEIGTMVSVLEIGAFVTSVAAGRVGDIIGRKGTLFLGSVVFTIGGTIQTFSAGFTSMVIGRIVSGFGVGLLSTIVPIYQSEISPPTHRGALACAEFTGNVFGYAFSVWTDYFCSFFNSDTSWRLPLFLQCVIGALLAAGSFLMPESPRWLIDSDKDEEGLRVLADLHGGDLNHPAAKAEFREIKEKVIFERDHGEGRSYVVMWKLYKRRVLLAMSSQAFAQLNGINVISYYAPRVFEQAGWIGREAILMTGVNALIYVFSTIPPWYLVDRWGRRPILLSGAGVMTLALGSTGLWIFLDLPNTPKAVVVSVIIYNAAFGYSWGPIPWLYPPEIMPLTVRAKGVSLSTCTNWAFNYLVGAATPWLQDVIHWRLYFMHAFFCMCSFMLVYFFYPETKGVPLEDMDAVFGEGSNKMLTERRASFDHEHIPFMSNTQRTLDTYPPKPSPSTVRSAPRRLLGRFFRPRSPYHPVENDENEELMALNGEVIDVHVDKSQETSHVDWTRD